MVEKLVEVGILFYFYGKLLSKRQYLVVDLFYIHDLSLAEIGEELGITRQGVYDALKRAEIKLYQYEDRLGLVNKFRNNHNQMEEILKITEEIKALAKKEANSLVIDKINLIENKVAKILKNS